MIIWWILISTALVSARNEELAEQFDDHVTCLRQQQNYIRNEQYVQVITVPRGADVILDCFTCVAPDDALEIESTYKPSAGAVGRAFKKVVDFFKKRLSKHANLFDTNKWKYDWQFAPIGMSWRDLTSVHAKKGFHEKISEKIYRFLNRDKNKKAMGDRYEIRIRNIGKDEIGFYRCINKQGGNHRISRMYFLDVHSNLSYSMKKSSDENLDKKLIPSQILPAYQLKIAPKKSPWSSCNRCGDDEGEQWRAIWCTYEVNVAYENLPNSSAWLRLFGDPPCSSSVVPLKIRKKSSEMPIFIQYRSCKTKCKPTKKRVETINSTDELGETRVMDFIPKGEFLFGELLPRLLPPVVRRGYLVTEGDPLVLTCQSDAEKNTGIQWHTQDALYLTLDGILEKYQGRVKVDGDGRLVFSKVEMSDEGLFHCYNVDNVLLVSHNVMVFENSRSKEIISGLNMILRFAAFVFIGILIIGLLMK